MSRSSTGTPTGGMSPHVSARSIAGSGHGSSVPSSRVAGLHSHSPRSDSPLVPLDSLRLADADVQDSPDSRGAAEAPPTRVRVHNLGRISSRSEMGAVASEHGRRGSYDATGTYIEPKEGDDAERDLPDESESEKRDESCESAVKQSPATSTPTTSDAVKNGGRLLIVANRLPLSMTVKKKMEEGTDKEVQTITFSNSSGGLVSALSGCDMESRWIGWPGAEVRREADRQMVSKKLEALKCKPVFLTQRVCDPFYNGFCNNLLWPLFHYIPLPVEAITSADAQFEAYKAANEAFAEAVLECYEEGDLVWVHDYHLMLLPSLLRAKHPAIKIGFFFHTPFPAYEIYRMLPARKELLDGVLAANLIGFHTSDYARHFQKCGQRILGATHGHDMLTYKGVTSQLGTFPIGIDPHKFIDTLKKPSIESVLAEYKREFKGRKVLLGIDRLDYIKGIQHKLYAFERLLEKYPALRSEVVLVQIAVPSRTDVVEYQKLRSSTHELVGRVNGLYGGVGHAPIHYLDQSIPFERMCALYSVSDAMVITSVRDGMNLVAFEYCASQRNHDGILILSEFAGAAQSLGAGPLLVNPWCITELCEAMRTALSMPMEERKRRQKIMYDYVLHHTAQRWAREYIKGLLTATGTPLSWLKEIEPAGASSSDTVPASAAPAPSAIRSTTHLDTGLPATKIDPHVDTALAQQQNTPDVSGAGSGSGARRITDKEQAESTASAPPINTAEQVVISLLSKKSLPSPHETFVREGSMFNLNRER